jgi:hypothetical protein
MAFILILINMSLTNTKSINHLTPRKMVGTSKFITESNLRQTSELTEY